MTKYFILIIVLLGTLAMTAGSSRDSMKGQSIPSCHATETSCADSTRGIAGLRI
jgi:hypothetical protein